MAFKGKQFFFVSVFIPAFLGACLHLLQPRIVLSWY